MISGRETENSKPSRRIVSISTPICISPRPATSKTSGLSVASILIETLPSTSRRRRSPIWRDVTNLPSRPANGELFTEKRTRTVGGSIAMRGSASRQRRVADGVAEVDRVDAGDHDEVARQRLLDLAAVEAVGAEELGDAERLRRARLGDAHHRGAAAQAAALDAADHQAADEVVVVERGGLELERALGVHDGRRHELEDRVEQRAQVAARRVDLAGGGGVLGRGVDHREVELVVGGAEIDEQVEDLVEHLGARAARRGRSC